MTASQTAQLTSKEHAGKPSRGKSRSAQKAKKSGDRMLACRYELKYLISDAQAAAVQ